MTKRILCAILAVIAIISLLPVQAMAAEGYTIGIQENKTVSAGSDVTLTLDLSKSSEASYNAFDVSLSYNAAKLTYKTCSLPASQVEQTDGSIRLVGYGGNKAKTKALATLTFTAKAAGTATVQIESAKIDRSSNAITHNAPQAAYDKKAATITVQQTYKVTLADGLTADSLEVVKGKSYTFKAADYSNYTYTVTAKIGSQKITVTDNKNGTYTIPAAQITGDIKVEATKTPKSYTVTLTGQDVTGEKTATYNKAYSFKLNRQTGYNYTVKVTVGGKGYSKYSVKNDTYTIPGTDITGNITVTVTRTKKTTTSGSTSTSTKTTTSSSKTTSSKSPSGSLKVEISGSGYSDTTGSPYIQKGSTYGFRIKKDEGYAYDISVQVDGKSVEFTYDEERDLYQVPGSVITGNMNIVVTKKVNVEVTEYITLDKKSLYLLLVPGDLGKKEVSKFDGQSMYRSEIYPGYTWLIQSDDSLETIRLLAEEKTAIAEGQWEASPDYSGNVNMMGQVDINDAQYVYDMYTGKYERPETTAMEFLGADVNGDQHVNILDVEWILSEIRTREEGGVG